MRKLWKDTIANFTVKFIVSSQKLKTAIKQKNCKSDQRLEQSQQNVYIKLVGALS